MSSANRFYLMTNASGEFLGTLTRNEQTAAEWREQGVRVLTLVEESATSEQAAREPVSNAYTLPDTLQAIVDAVAAYEKKHGAWQDYRMSMRDEAFPVDKTERAIVVAYRKHDAALGTTDGGRDG